VSEALDLFDEAGATAKAGRDVRVVGSLLPPSQYPTFYRSQDLVLAQGLPAREASKVNHTFDEFRAATEASRDLHMVHAIRSQAKNPTFDGAQCSSFYHCSPLS